MTSSRMRLLASKMTRASLLVTCAVSISGCGLSWLAPRDTNPIIQDYVTPTTFVKRSTNMFATTASRRLVIVTESKDSFLTCAEPPPDVGEAFASQVAAGLQGAATATQGSGAKVTGDIAAQFGRAVATQIAPLLYRTQGLQLYRDAMYKLCIDRMNGWIDEKDYAAQREARFKDAAALITAELPTMQEAVKAFYASVKAGEAKVNVEDVVKILDAQRPQQPQQPPK